MVLTAKALIKEDESIKLLIGNSDEVKA